ncbi:MAG: hypothetical protein LBD79_06405 [Treponema sp.]|jgi:hypothetical protein|nr:hypothetical protein [Treponema sp.]
MKRRCLDEELSTTVTRFGTPRSHWLIRRELRQPELVKRSANYLLTIAAASHKSPAQIIDEMVLERVAAATI